MTLMTLMTFAPQHLVLYDTAWYVQYPSLKNYRGSELKLHEITDSYPSNKVSPQMGRASPLLPFRSLYRKHQWFDIFGATFIQVTPQGKKIWPMLGESVQYTSVILCDLPKNHSLFGLVIIWPLLQSRFITDIWTEFVPVTWGFEVFYRCKGWRICFSQIPCTKRISYRCKDVQSWDSLWSRQKRTNIWISSWWFQIFVLFTLTWGFNC